MTTTGERIAQMRKQRGLTQAKLANLAGISTSAVAMYETNRRQPDENTITLIARALEVQVGELGGHAHVTATEAEKPAGQAEPYLMSSPDGHRAASPVQLSNEIGWTNLALSREEARFILFMRMNRDVHEFLQEYMNADAQKRKQIEKAWRLIQAFQA